MSGFLFSDVVFGPVKSRRLGISLGINLLPTDYKFCSFNCIYCECGWTRRDGKEGEKLPGAGLIRHKLEERMKELSREKRIPDAITFAGNGEPTLHPEFPEIVDITIELRDAYIPAADITVLSNASQIDNEKVFNALQKVDKNILKLDAGTEEIFQQINRPRANLSLEKIVHYLKKFNGHLIIQSLFLEGVINGEQVSNTSDKEIYAWINLLKEINPLYVMIYPVDRGTAAQDIRKLSFGELNRIAGKVESEGFKTQVFG
ncbi:MAG: radical SAM protein [Bacteroidales bacterium]